MKNICRVSGEEFEITDDDLAFYHKVSPVLEGKKFLVPPPRLAPEARVQRKLMWRNERNLYRRKCDFSGKEIISTYAPEAPFRVYEQSVWVSDCWEALKFGRDFDFSRPFFDQFKELMAAVPVCSLMHRQNEENCPYTNYVSGNKNCHIIFNASSNESCFYSTYLQRCRDVCDCFFIFDSELCYECLDCSKCYGLKYSQECDGCSDSEYLIGCTACQNCFACVSLMREQYCIFNKRYSKTEFQSTLANIKSKPGWRESVAQQLDELSASTPRKFYSGMKNENFSGDHILSCKNTFESFDVTNLEDCKNCIWLHKAKDCRDCYAWGLPGELGYENHLCGDNFYDCIFCENCWNNVSHLAYCRDCYNGCRHLFGCIGLARKEYCIFNEQYGEREFYSLAAKIIQHMQETGEWGEFFPPALSPYGYNETVAAEYFPLTREEVLQAGWNWRDASLPGIYGKAQRKGAELEIDASEADPDISNEIIECAASGKNYKITKAELELYKKLNVPLPKLCFDARHEARAAKRNPRRLREATCDSCTQAFLTAFRDDDKGVLYCEACFHRTR